MKRSPTTRVARSRAVTRLSGLKDALGDFLSDDLAAEIDRDQRQRATMPAKADEVLPVLDRCAALMRRAG